MNRIKLKRKKHLRLRLCIFCLLVAIARRAASIFSVDPLPLIPPDAIGQTLCIYETHNDAVHETELESYLLRVVAAEMPASYHKEALQAQAVASRSYTCFRMHCFGGKGCASHPEADVCTDSACCQAALNSNDVIDERISDAVRSTTGQVLTYDGRIINALYHACSGGQTEEAASVFSSALPYLQSVSSPGEEPYPQYSSQAVFTFKQLSDLFALDEMLPLAEQFSIEQTSSTGRAVLIRAGTEFFSGSQFRSILSLPSAMLRFDFEGDSMTVFTTGSGHGVGLSQVGADAMAWSGADYADILSHYYTGCELSSL